MNARIIFGQSHHHFNTYRQCSDSLTMLFSSTVHVAPPQTGAADGDSGTSPGRPLAYRATFGLHNCSLKLVLCGWSYWLLDDRNFFRFQVQVDQAWLAGTTYDLLCPRWKMAIRFLHGVLQVPHSLQSLVAPVSYISCCIYKTISVLNMHAHLDRSSLIYL